jgi:hypothetical protein
VEPSVLPLCFARHSLLTDLSNTRSCRLPLSRSNPAYGTHPTVTRCVRVLLASAVTTSLFLYYHYYSYYCCYYYYSLVYLHAGDQLESDVQLSWASSLPSPRRFRYRYGFLSSYSLVASTSVPALPSRLFLAHSDAPPSSSATICRHRLSSQNHFRWRGVWVVFAAAHFAVSPAPIRLLGSINTSGSDITKCKQHQSAQQENTQREETKMMVAACWMRPSGLVRTSAIL